MSRNGAAVAEHRALIIYDGDCIFCQNYARLVKLREAVGPVELIDARSGDNRDFLKFRYAPFERSPICRVSGSLNNKALSAHYYPAGLERFREIGVGFEPTDERVGLAERFPCAQEVARAAYWFDRAGGRPRDAADVTAMHLLFDASHRRPLSCMLAYQALTKRVDMEPVPDAAGAINGNCEADLVSAEAFQRALTDEPEAAKLRKSLEDAKTAFVSGQTGACLMATAKVRGSYLDRFRDPSGAANGVQHKAGPPLPAE